VSRAVGVCTTTFAAALTVVVSMPGAARGQSVEPYRDPAFTCEVVDYGTSPPTLPAPPQDPLCVRYDKTNITVADLGVVDFLAAEPGRIAIAAGKCRYWQQDHWVVRAAPDTTPVVEWEGSYWYDALTGAGAGILRNLRVGGQPADGAEFADAMAPLVGDETAERMRAFAAEGGGGGATFALPEGFGLAACDTEAPPDPGPGTSPPVDPPAVPPDASGGNAAVVRGADDLRLAATGETSMAITALVVLALAAAARRRQ
jgi:hypothetical protein